MNFIKRIFGGGKNNEVQQQPSESETTERWDDLAEVQFNDAEKAKSERQQRKILAAFSACEYGGHFDESVINQPDVVMTDAIFNDAMSLFANNRISRSEIKSFLTKVTGPMQAEGFSENLADKLSTEDEFRIMAFMSGSKMDAWKNISPDNIELFAKKYPTPIDFEHDSRVFLDIVKANSGPEEFAQYEKAMESFKNKVYGKKQEYWKQIQEIQDFAFMHRAQFPEKERSAEWQPGDSGYYQTSRQQSADGLVTRENIDSGLWATEKCEDSFFGDPSRQMYGVFDGAGGVNGGRIASRMTAEIVRQFSDNENCNSGLGLAKLLEFASAKVVNNPQAGLSTASLAKVVKRGNGCVLAFAQAGDSRIYIINKDNIARQISKDEGVGNAITNAIGMSNNGVLNHVKQYGEIPLNPGDRVMICSDGITGDFGSDLVSEDEIGSVFRRSHDATEAAKNLVANARKKDDRTAYVFVPNNVGE